MTVPRATGVSFSIDELVQLAATLGLPPMPVLGPSPLDALDPAEMRFVLSAANRSLVARGVIDAGTGEVLPAVATLLEIVARPLVLARAARRAAGSMTTRFFAVVTDVGVEITREAYGVHRLYPFPAVDLVARLFESAELLGPRSVAAAPVFSVTNAVLESCLEAVDRADGGEARGHLRGSGIPEATTNILLPHTGATWSVVTFLVVHRPATQRIDGGEITILDVDQRDLWIMRRIDNGTRAELEPISSEAVALELVTCLPAS